MSMTAKRRRLPQHDFVQMVGRPEYAWCAYPDPDNWQSRICGMTKQWHIRDAEERAAEAEEPEEQLRPLAYVGWPSVPVTPVCTVHGVEHDIEVKVRIYTIQTASGKDVRWYLCDQIAMQLELLPLP